MKKIAYVIINEENELIYASYNEDDIPIYMMENLGCDLNDLNEDSEENYDYKEDYEDFDDDDNYQDDDSDDDSNEEHKYRVIKVDMNNFKDADCYLELGYGIEIPYSDIDELLE